VNHQIQEAATKLSREELIAYVHRSVRTQQGFREWAGVSRQAVHKWKTTPEFAHSMTERARAWWALQQQAYLDEICR
jgi:hypothetical protein